MTEAEAIKALKAAKVHGASVDFGRGAFVARDGRAAWRVPVVEGGRLHFASMGLDQTIARLRAMGLVG